ncbi:MAG: DNA repair protein RadA [Eubacteriales bacterium]
MPKSNTCYLCSECGYESAKWYGKCPSCGEWNTMSQFTPVKEQKRGILTGASEKSIFEVSLDENSRIKTSFAELDRVLGGGIVLGGVVLIGGEPGVGKSTLLLQVAENVCANEDKAVLYVSGEESVGQIKMRASRVGVKSKKLLVLNETEVSLIIQKIEELSPCLVVIDSIQTLYDSAINGAAGAVSQVKECAAKLTKIAKMSSIPIFLIGHVTKEGSIAGPRILEHMVDTVLYFEGENLNSYRVIRAVKNRFGSTNEISVFEMGINGISEVSNFGGLFIAEREINVPGSAVFCAMEGTRPVLMEIQALVSKTAFNIPRRMTSGVDFNRTSLILAVLEKKAGIKLYDQDVYVNVAGGIKLNDPSADLAIAAAIVSAYRNKALNDCVIAGEIGLTGQIRTVARADRRAEESKRFGFKKLILPKGNAFLNTDMDMVFVKNIWEALVAMFPRDKEA